VVLASTLGAWLGKESCTQLYVVDAFKGVYWGGALFSALCWALRVLDVLGVVAGDVSLAFSVEVDLVADENVMLYGISCFEPSLSEQLFL
jgi:hypothetical protein